VLAASQGTPAFMAPEVFDRAFSLPADMWSMGMLAYQAVANRCVLHIPAMRSHNCYSMQLVAVWQQGARIL
jgi:serine/threonine protein kinase